jgi:hypothetical protein
VLSVATVGGMVALLVVSMPWLRARRWAEAKRAARTKHSPPRRRHAAPSRRLSRAGNQELSRAGQEEPARAAQQGTQQGTQSAGAGGHAPRTMVTGVDDRPRLPDRTSGKGLTKSL